MDALCKLCRMCNVNTVKGPCPGFWPGFLFDYELRTGGVFDIWENEQVTGSPLRSGYLKAV